MPAAKSTIAPKYNYVRIHTLIDAYKINVQWWEAKRRYISMYLRPEEGGVSAVVSGEGPTSVEAVVDLLTTLGHGKELYL